MSAHEDARRRMTRFREALGKFSWPEDEAVGHARVCELVKEFGITPAEFRCLDEKAGQWMDRNKWHWKLRRTRNSHAPLFEALGANMATLKG